MDCNSYSYAPHMLDGETQTYADYESDDFGYITLTLEQWGIDPDIRQFVVSGFCFDKTAQEYKNFNESFQTDISRGWETMRYAFARAAKVFNSIVPESECIPLF